MLALKNLHFLLYICIYKEKEAVSGWCLGQEAVGWLEAGRVFVSPRALRQKEHPCAIQEDDTHPCCHGYCWEQGEGPARNQWPSPDWHCHPREGKTLPDISETALSTTTDIYTQVLSAGNVSKPNWRQENILSSFISPAKMMPKILDWYTVLY